MSKKIYKYVFPMLFLYFILTGLLFIYNDYSVSFLMPMAPVIYGICLGLIYAKRPRAFASFSVLIIYAISFIRMVFIPVIYVMSGYVSTIETSTGTEYLNEAVILVCYEMFCTTLLVLSSKKLSQLNAYPVNTDWEGEGKIKFQVKIILVCLVILGVVCVLADKNVLVIISTVFDRFMATTEINIERRKLYLSTRENSSLAFELFSQVVFYLQILIPASLISYAINRRNESNTNKGIIVSFLIAVTSVLFVTDNNIDSVCIMLACLIVVYLVYYKKMSKIISLILIAMASFIVLFLFAKDGMLSGDGIKFNQISSILCSYFAAFPNVSCGFAVKYTDKFATFLGDIVAGVPYLMAFFHGLPQSVTLFNIAAHGYTGVSDQIMPLISYGYQFLGFLAPVFTIVTYNIAFKLEIEFRKTYSTFNCVLYALMFVNLSIGPCIFGFPNTIRRLCYYIPLIILAKMNSDFR